MGKDFVLGTVQEKKCPFPEESIVVNMQAGKAQRNNKIVLVYEKLLEYAICLLIAKIPGALFILPLFPASFAGALPLGFHGLPSILGILLLVCCLCLPGSCGGAELCLSICLTASSGTCQATEKGKGTKRNNPCSLMKGIGE